MTVKSIKTLGANPLVLLRKLAAIEGCTIEKSVTTTDSDSVEYEARQVVKIKDGLYIEVKDEVYSYLATNPAAFPCHYLVSTMKGKLKQEALESDKSTAYAFANNSADTLCCSIGLKGSNTVSSGYLTDLPFSLLMTVPIRSAGGLGNFQVPDANSTNSKSVAFPIFTGELGSGETFTGSYYVSGSARTENTAYPFGIINIDSFNFGSRTDYGFSCLFFFLWGTFCGETMPVPLVFAATRFRLAKSIDANTKELVNPSSWAQLPIFTDVTAFDDGLIFSTPTTYGEYLVVTTVDTSKGNALTGTFPVSYRNTKYGNSGNTVVAERAMVVGDSSSATSEVSMTPYAPSLPISNDSVTGGPVVSNVFTITTDEIRGSVPGMLSCNISLPIATMGWLNGEKYKVIYPGRMALVG